MAKTTRTPSENTQIAVMANDLGYVRKAVDDLSDKIDHNYVTVEKFAGVISRISMLEKLVYGLVGLILTAVVIALLSLVVSK